MMGRERILKAVTVAFAAVLLTATSALAASPRQIYGDLADNGKLNKTYSAGDLRNAVHDATLQGYGGVEVVTLAPQATQGVAGSSKTLSGAPLRTTGRSGALPFTGVELGVYVGIGIALLAGGLLLRRMGGAHRRS